MPHNSKTAHLKAAYILAVISVLFVLPVANSAPDSSQTNQSQTNLPTAKARALLEPWNNDDQPGVAVAIMSQGEVVMSAGVGLANLEYGIAIKPNTVFGAASLSKQVTAFAIFTLAADGKLSLGDDIRQYLPELKRVDSTVTIKHLLEHMGGFREVSTLSIIAGQQEDDVETNAQIYRLIANQIGGNFAPGAEVEYSNTGYILLGKIVEAVSGQSFRRFTAERLFEPLGMTHTQFNDDRKRLILNRAYSYQNTTEGFTKADLNSEKVASTGLQTTTNDLLKWANNLNTQALGKPAVFKMMAARSQALDASESVLANGQELRLYRGMQTWSHGGRDEGFRSFLIRIPEQQFAISILSNRADFDTAKLAFKLIDLYFDNKERLIESPWQVADSETLQQYVGDYELFPGTIFSISTSGDALQFSNYRAGDKSTLPQIGERRFSLNRAKGLSIEFKVDEQQEVVALDYIIGLHGAISAPKLALLPFNQEDLELSDFVGDFFSQELESLYKISIVDNQLVVTPARLLPIELAPYQADTFSSAHGNFPKIEFVRDTNGVVTACLVSGPLADDVLFRRIKLPRNPS